ncbi:hypothetical protein T492DRAFT_965763 [Pavlovales sp. CCMP2436]|nr:hypothetical protein T492DRAFT_965763 [Pavlovales sp. CCMP2436]
MLRIHPPQPAARPYSVNQVGSVIAAARFEVGSQTQRSHAQLHAAPGGGGGGYVDMPPESAMMGGGGSSRRHKDVPLALWELPLPVQGSREWADRQTCEEEMLQAKADLRHALVLEFGPGAPSLLCSYQTTFEDRVARARLQYNSSPHLSPRARFAAMRSESVGEAVEMLRDTSRNRKHARFLAHHRLFVPTRPLHEPLALPQIPARAKARLPRLTLAKGLPKVSAKLELAAAEPSNPSAFVGPRQGSRQSFKGSELVLTVSKTRSFGLLPPPGGRGGGGAAVPILQMHAFGHAPYTRGGGPVAFGMWSQGL